MPSSCSHIDLVQSLHEILCPLTHPYTWVHVSRPLLGMALRPVLVPYKVVRWPGTRRPNLGVLIWHCALSRSLWEGGTYHSPQGRGKSP